MKQIVFISSLVLNVLLLFACIFLLSRPKNNTKQVDQQEKMFESVLNEGDIAFIGGERISVCSWADLFANYTIRNKGIFHNTIEDEKKRMDALVKNTPSQVFIMLGMEELKNKVPVNQIIEQYKDYLETLRQRSPMTEIIVLSLIPVSNERDNDYAGVDKESLKAFNTFMKLYALENNLSYVNLYEDFVNEGGLLNLQYSKNGFNLSTSAYYIMKDRLMPYLRK